MEWDLPPIPVVVAIPIWDAIPMRDVVVHEEALSAQQIYEDGDFLLLEKMEAVLQRVLGDSQTPLRENQKIEEELQDYEASKRMWSRNKSVNAEYYKTARLDLLGPGQTSTLLSAFESLIFRTDELVRAFLSHPPSKPAIESEVIQSCLNDLQAVKSTCQPTAIAYAVETQG